MVTCLITNLKRSNKNDTFAGSGSSSSDSNSISSGDVDCNTLLAGLSGQKWGHIVRIVHQRVEQ